MEKTQDLRRIAFAALVALLAFARAADAKEPSKATPTRGKIGRTTKSPTVYGGHGPFGWCADELETLPNGLCHIDGGQKEGRRTLVVFLHGMIARDVDWQWLQERALTRQAKASKFDAIFAKAPLGPGGFIWPGSVKDQETSEQDLIDDWNAARQVLETRNGRPYDEVFLMGFSSGAYFTSALALRGRVRFDGYAVFAGGAGGLAAPNVTEKAPFYVGVCADDAQTAQHSRGLGGALAARGWPSRVDEQHVGHMFSDVHIAHAIAYLRGAQRKPAASKAPLSGEAPRD